MDVRQCVCSLWARAVLHRHCRQTACAVHTAPRRRAYATLQQYTQQTIADLQEDDDELLKGVDWRAVSAASAVSPQPTAQQVRDSTARTLACRRFDGMLPSLPQRPGSARCIFVLPRVGAHACRAASTTRTTRARPRDPAWAAAPRSSSARPRRPAASRRCCRRPHLWAAVQTRRRPAASPARWRLPLVLLWRRRLPCARWAAAGCPGRSS
jgi:hypothetical protein